MKLFAYLLLLIFCYATAQANDDRLDLRFTTQERTVFLADMRNMLSSIQDILRGIGSGDRDLIAEAARRSGNRMSRATPASIRAKLPAAFKDIGGPTHLAFEELAIRAGTDEMDSLARDTAEIMNQCKACHALFRVQ